MPVITPVLAPAVVAGVCFLVSWRLWNRTAPAPRGHWGGAVAFGLAYFAGHVLLVGGPGIPPNSAETWQAYFAFGFAAFGAAQRWWGTKWFTSWPVAFLAYTGFLTALLWNSIKYHWEQTESLLWVVGLAAALLVVFQVVDTIAAKRPGATVPLALWTLCALTSVTFVVGQSALLGQLAGALAAACGAAVVLAWWSPDWSLSRGAVVAFVPMYAGLVARGYFYGELPPVAAALLVLAPLALLVGEQRRFVYANPWIAALVRMGAIAIPAAVALGVTYAVAGGEEPSGYYDY